MEAAYQQVKHGHLSGHMYHCITRQSDLTARVQYLSIQIEDNTRLGEASVEQASHQQDSSADRISLVDTLTIDVDISQMGMYDGQERA